MSSAYAAACFAAAAAAAAMPHAAYVTPGLRFRFRLLLTRRCFTACLTLDAAATFFDHALRCHFAFEAYAFSLIERAASAWRDRAAI